MAEWVCWWVGEGVSGWVGGLGLGLGLVRVS